MPVNIGYSQPFGPSRYLKPSGSGEIDVTQMAWTLTPQSGRIEVPTMYLVEYQQNVGQLISAMIYYTKATTAAIGNPGSILSGSSDKDIYQYKYFAVPTGFTYKIPYFSQHRTNKTNSFPEENGQNPFSGIKGLTDLLPSLSFGKGGLIGTVLAGGAALVGLADTILPGKVNLENPKSWSASTNAAYSIAWDLYNTGTVQDIINNRNLAYILSYQNSPARRSAFIVDPPVIYSMFIPDVVSMPACYVSSITILNLGNTRQVKLGGVDRIIPEGYRFNLTFTSLLMDTRNIMNGLDTDNVVTAISDSTALTQLMSDIANGNLSEETYYSNPSAYDAAAANASKVDKQFGLAPGTSQSNAARVSGLTGH